MYDIILHRKNFKICPGSAIFAPYQNTDLKIFETITLFYLNKKGFI